MLRLQKKNVAESEKGSEVTDAAAKEVVHAENLKASLDALTKGLESVFAAEKNATLVHASHEGESNNHDEPAREIRS